MTERVVTKEGRNAIRSLLNDLLAEASVGTGDSEPREGDTELDDEVYRADVSNSSEDTGEMVSRLRLGAGDANEPDLSELMLHTEDDESFARLVFSETEKSDQVEIEFEITVRNENP